jgi:hypothetical protein
MERHCPHARGWAVQYRLFGLPRQRKSRQPVPEMVKGFRTVPTRSLLPGNVKRTLSHLGHLGKQTHYGPPQDRTKLLEDDGVDRGLLFMAYAGAITDQFQFVTHTWVNQADAPHHGEPETGHDPLISQKIGARFIRLPIDGDVTHDQQMALPEDAWVVMTGGGYFFTPSVSALAGALAEE